MTKAETWSQRASVSWVQPRSVLRIAGSLAAVTSTVVLIGLTSAPATPGAASTSSYAVIGDYPGPNTPTLSAETANLADSCNLGDSSGNSTPTEGSTAGSYIPDMNAWQGKSSAVISCYQQVNPTLFTDQVPEIWDEFDAVPMLNLSEANYNSSLPGLTWTMNNTLQSFGTSLGQWLFDTDNLGHSAPTNGRRIYLRWDWEANATWYSYSPLAESPATCSQLANDEVTYVDRWQQVYNAIMNAASAAAGGRNLSNNVAWVYSVNAFEGGAPTLPSALQNCPSTPGTSTMYEPVYLGTVQIGTQSVATTGLVANPSDIEASLFPMNNFSGPDYNSATRYVQWLGMDGYSQCSTETPSQVFANELTTLHGLSSSLPVSIDEVGANIEDNNAPCTGTPPASEKATWLSEYMSWLQSNNLIKMSLLFNDDDYQGSDWSVFCEPTAENEYDPLCNTTSTGDFTYGGIAGNNYRVYSEYPQALSSSYFIGADPSNSQVLTDPQFLGQ